MIAKSISTTIRTLMTGDSRQPGQYDPPRAHHSSEVVSLGRASRFPLHAVVGGLRPEPATSEAREADSVQVQSPVRIDYMPNVASSRRLAIAVAERIGEVVPPPLTVGGASFSTPTASSLAAPQIRRARDSNLDVLAEWFSTSNQRPVSF